MSPGKCAPKRPDILTRVLRRFRPLGAIVGDKIVCLICGGRGIITPPHILAGAFDVCPICRGKGGA